jgi:hypothetical protein
MEQLSVYNILGYGVIGLGFLLAFFAYCLLAREQQKAEASRPVLTAIYVFMLFSVVLCGAGFASEYIRYRTDPKLSAKVESLEGELAERNAEINRQRLLLEKYRSRVREAAKKNENIIKNLKLIAAFTPAKLKPYLTEAIDTLRTPVVLDD